MAKEKMCVSIIHVGRPLCAGMQGKKYFFINNHRLVEVEYCGAHTCLHVLLLKGCVPQGGHEKEREGGVQKI